MNMRDFDLACELLPEGVTWGEAITPSIVKHIAEAAIAAQARYSTGLSEQLREYAGNNGYGHNDYADTMLAAATEIEQLAAQAQQQREVTDEQILHLQHEFYNFTIRRISRQKLHANVRSILLELQEQQP